MMAMCGKFASDLASYVTNYFSKEEQPAPKPDPEQIINLVDDSFDEPPAPLEENYKKYIEADPCSICFEDFSPRDYLQQKIHRTSCHHFYHTSCIEDWVNRNQEIKKCPNCITPLKFAEEQTEWKTYLDSINHLMKEKFPIESALIEKSNIDEKNSDAVIAFLLQEEENEELKRFKQIKKDEKLAKALSEEAEINIIP